MNQDKLAMVRQEMARVNINTLGISELKCTGRRNRVALIVNRTV